MPKVLPRMRWLAAWLCAAAWVPLRGQDAGGAQLAWAGSAMQERVTTPATRTTADASASLTDVQAVLLEMATHAAVIFAGQVLSVSRHEAEGYADVRFRVDEAVRGCSTGRAYVLREWAGRWTGQAAPYRAGQRLLMLLTARGPSGMSAPVYGPDGAIPLLGAGSEPLLDAQGNVPADAGVSAELAVDLRWLAARAVRSVGVSRVVSTTASQVHAATVAEPITGDPVASAPGTTNPVSSPSVWVGPVAPLAGSAASGTSSGSTATQSSLSAVLALLASGGGAHVYR